MFGKARCKCPRCVARRQIRFLAFFGVCTAGAIGYFTVDDHREIAPKLSLEAFEEPAEEPGAGHPSISSGNSESVVEVAQTGPEAQQQDSVISDTPEDPSTVDNASVSIQDQTGIGTLSDDDLQPASDPLSNPVAESPLPGSSPEPVKDESNAPRFAVTSPDEDLAMAYRSDPYGLLPPWLTESGFEVPRKSHPSSADERESVAQNRENANLYLGPGAQEAPTTALPEPKSGTSETAEPDEKNPEPLLTHGEAPAPTPKQAPDRTGRLVSTAQVAVPSSENDTAPPASGASIPAENSRPAVLKTVSAPGRPEPSQQQPKIAEPVPQTTSKRPLASGNNANGLSEDATKGSELKLAGTFSFIAIQGNDPLKNAPSQERREPQGYITVESKRESPRSAVGRDRPLKPSQHGPRIEDHPMESQDDPPKSQDHPSKDKDEPAKPGDESADLQRFASDFVRTDQTGSVADQHRFYADSVHFHGEGDLSWAGVAAATRRYHQEKQNRRYGAAAPAIVKGPVDGGFYVVDQPVSWSRTDGSRLTRGRTMLHLRVVQNGRGSWKITSIEEVRQ
jgi:hypothetical protein